jgi:hypothetical protein
VCPDCEVEIAVEALKELSLSGCIFKADRNTCA